MKSYVSKLILILSSVMICGIAIAKSGGDVKPYALIYSGINSCEGCPEALADVAGKANLAVKFVSKPSQIPGLLKHAAILMIGGTEDHIEPMRLSFSKDTISAIKAYLNNGGKYLGVCGGGFIAAKYYMAEENLKVKGLGIIPAEAVDYSESSKAHLETITWNNEKVSLYFQGGPKFIMDKDAKDYNVIARYSNGDIAALLYTHGKGTVIVIGPHPEADRTWLEEDHIDAPDWTPSQELIVQLLRESSKN